MNSKEILKTASELWAQLENDKIQPKDIKTQLKAMGAAQRKMSRDLKNWAKWSKIAKKRNELTVLHIDPGGTLYLVPLSSKEFYFGPGSEPEELFSIEDTDYIIVYRDE